MQRDRLPTLLEVAAAQVGFRKAVTALTFLVKWGMYVELHPDAPRTMEAFKDFALLSRAQAFRQQAIFNEAFPALDGVDAVWSRVRDEIDRKASERAQAAQACSVRIAT